MKTLIHSPATCGAGFHAGPLSAHAQAFCLHNELLGFAARSCAYHRLLLAQFDLWLKRRKRLAADVDEALVARFLPVAHGHRRLSARAALRRFLAWLRARGVIAPAVPAVALCPAGALVHVFTRFLSQQCALSAETCRAYARIARVFLRACFGRGALDLGRLRARDVIAFVRRNACASRRSRTLKLVTSLRSFLRFARQRGYVGCDLAASVPRVACWKLAGLPKALAPDEVARVLECCERGSAQGLRDYAVLLLLARLGLRAGEVAALRLEDIDWARAELVVRSKKGGGLCRLPLSREVGGALARYLRGARPGCASRHVFARLRGAPREDFASVGLIGAIVRRALARAGINPPRKGAHLFRHALARDLLKGGASLEQIGRVLRHKSAEATAIYAKVDLEALRTLAMPWIGGAL